MAHINKDLDITVHVFVVYQNKVLLRKHDKYQHLLGVGGHVELGEDPNHAAIREVREEVGLEVKLVNPFSPVIGDDFYRSLVPPVCMNRHTPKPGHDHMDMIYFAKSTTDKVVQGKTEVSENIGWYTLEELASQTLSIHPVIRAYAQAALSSVQ
jgi:ADP-ribose pyrophosphatase YjhB (NUDIX family)